MRNLIAGLLLVVCITGCGDFYDNVGKPIYKGVKAGVKMSHINPKTKERLKKLDEKAIIYDDTRTAIKKNVQ